MKSETSQVNSVEKMNGSLDKAGTAQSSPRSKNEIEGKVMKPENPEHPPERRRQNATGNPAASQVDDPPKTVESTGVKGKSEENNTVTPPDNKTETKRISIDDLSLHAKNKEIYGDERDKELEESIRQNGVLQTILVTPDLKKTGKHIVLSGNRRFVAAKTVGIKELDVHLFHTDDELECLAALLEGNRQRIKTPEQIGREFKLLKEVEGELAKRRMAEKGVVNLPPLEKGKARDIAAAKLGVSGTTAEHAAAVVDQIDRHITEGKPEEAKELREKLNKGSVNAAFKQLPKKAEGGKKRGVRPKKAVTPLPVASGGDGGAIESNPIPQSAVEAAPRSEVDRQQDGVAKVTQSSEVVPSQSFAMADGTTMDVEWHSGAISPKQVQDELQRRREGEKDLIKLTRIEKLFVNLADLTNSLSGKSTTKIAIDDLHEACGWITDILCKKTTWYRP